MDESRITDVDGRASLAANSLARLGASLTTLFCAFWTGVITARWLGPSGKGTLAALAIVGVLLFRLCGLGLGEAAIILKRRHGVPLQAVLSASFIPVSISAAFGIAGLLVVVFIADWYPIIDAVVAQGAVLVLALFSNLLLGALNARERFQVSSALTAGRDFIVVLATVTFVVLLGHGIFGAVLAAAVAEALLLLASALATRQEGLRLTPGWDESVMRRALPTAIVFQASYLLTAMAQRLDQLIVYQLNGPAAGGQYSVALTISQLTAYAAGALSTVAFPRIAYLDSSVADDLIARVARVSLATALIVAPIIAAVLPIGVRMVFGDAYKPAVVPALLLLIGAVIYSQQIALARAAAARGEPTLLVSSFFINIVTMVALGYWFIPDLGINGGAIASIGGSLAGYLVCLYAYRKGSGLHIPFIDLIPKKADFVDVMKKLGGIVRRLRTLLRP